MTRYILNCLARQKWVVFSWGFHHPTAKNNGLQFSVNGFIHKGLVEVNYNQGTDLFDITLIKKNEVSITITDVHLDELIDTLDRHIEKDESDENYQKRVKQEYSSLL